MKKFWISKFWDPVVRNVSRPKKLSERPWRKRVWMPRVEKVTDTMEIAGYGVFGTPAVVVDGDVKSVGKIPKKARSKNLGRSVNAFHAK